MVHWLITHSLGRKVFMEGTDWPFIAPDLQLRLSTVHTTMDCRTCSPHAYSDIHGVHVTSRRVFPFLPSKYETEKKRKSCIGCKKPEDRLSSRGCYRVRQIPHSWWTGMMAQEMICVWFSALTQSPTHTIHDAETADVPLQQALLVSRLPGCRFLSSSYSRRTSCPTCLAYGPRGTCIFLSVRVVAELLPQVPDCR